MDIWVNKTPDNFVSLQKAITAFGLPAEAYPLSTIERIDEIDIRVIHINQLIQAKKAAGRHKDLNDIENLPQPGE